MSLLQVVFMVVVVVLLGKVQESTQHPADGKAVRKAPFGPIHKSSPRDSQRVDESAAWNFGNMVSCVVDLWPWETSVYLDYGCFCGYGGGGTPVDATDQCCSDHDDCYGDIVNDGTCTDSNAVYTLSYSYTCTSPTSYWYWSEQLEVSCDGEAGSCAQATCECDRIAALCFLDNRATFDTGTYYNYQGC